MAKPQDQPVRLIVVVAAAYYALMLAAIYGIYNTSRGNEHFWLEGGGWLGLVLLHLLLGFAVGRAWSLLLPLTLPWLALPAGANTLGDDNGLLFWMFVGYLVLYVPAVAIGIGARKLFRWVPRALSA